ncbi:MAG: hydantoinase/oxoprolinase N-terminal domain-containing protein [Solirubrobacteraceae bacterium]
MAELRLSLSVGDDGAAAILLDRRGRVLSRARVACERDEPSTIVAAIRSLLGASRANPGQIAGAVLGSPAALRAIERRGGLRRVAVLRIGSPLTLAVHPLATWPETLRRAVSAGEGIAGGGAEYDGREVTALDVEAVERFLAEVAGVAEAVAITSQFSSVAPEHELAARELVRGCLGAATPVSLSHELGTIGLLARENATVLNAALGGVAELLVSTLRGALEAEDIDAEPFFAKSDGTVMTLEHTVRYPFHMVGSGPASAIRGAAWLSGLPDAAVVDAGAQSTSIGGLVGGLPRERPTPTEIAGVRANFHVPHLVRLPYRGADALVDGALAEAVEEMRIARPPAPLVVVGAAAERAGEQLEGLGDLVIPKDGAVAEAVGLAIGPAGGNADRICINRPAIRATTIEAARADAVARAIHAGADPERVQVIDIQEIPLSYVLDPAIRIRARAAGPPL